MAAVEHFSAGAAPVPAPPPPTTTNGSSHANGGPGVDSHSHATDIPDASNAGIQGKCCSRPQQGDKRIVVVVYNQGQDKITSIFANVLGKPFRLRNAFADVNDADRGHVIGIPDSAAKADVDARDRALIVAINAHCVDLGMPPDAQLSSSCDYEFLYAESSPFHRRDLARFLSFVLGQISPHESLMTKPRTYFISTTFPDVCAALPNLDILTVGADAVEIRVDLLQEPVGGDGGFASIPSLSYVGRQVMLLRRATELPLIFTTRCTRENGRFPMEDPELYYEYLYRAVQWGVEYIDVELWLPEAVRERLWQRKGNSRIMSAFHDFSGTFKWPSPHAQDVFKRSTQYADIVKMIAIINDHNENFELEYFRSRMRAEYPDAPPLSAVNMGETGQFSRTLNRVFTPITHPLLPIIAAPGQMSAAEINAALSLLGQLPKKNVYGIHCGGVGSGGSVGGGGAPFYEKCFNELGLPHQFAVVERGPAGGGGGALDLDLWCNQRNFGGAYLNPPVPCPSIAQSAFFASLNGGEGPVLTEAARAIGMVDTIVVHAGSASSFDAAMGDAGLSPSSSSGGGGGGGSGAAAQALPPDASIVLDNSVWRGILNCLTKEFSPSAYFGRPAVVLASSGDDAASALFALSALSVSKIYTVGFKTPASLAASAAAPIEPFNSLESLRRARRGGASPFVVVSALPAEKSALVGMLLRVFSGGGSSGVFLDLANDGRGAAAVGAEGLGFVKYGAADVLAFTTVETLKALVGQNVPYSFVRLAGGRRLY